MQLGSRVLFFILLFLPLTVMAAPGAGHGEGIPWKMIGVQAFNFFFLIGVLVFVLRKTVASHFQERRRVYQELVSKAEVAKQEAEKNHREITERLNALKSTSKENADKAKADALELKQRLLTEAKEISAKLKLDAEKTTEIEIQKAKNEIRNFVLNEALKSAEEKLSKQTDSADHGRLQSEFIEKIQAVNS